MSVLWLPLLECSFAKCTSLVVGGAKSHRYHSCQSSFSFSHVGRDDAIVATPAQWLVIFRSSRPNMRGCERERNNALVDRKKAQAETR